MPETNIAKPEIYNRQRQQFHPPHIDVIHMNGYSFLFTEYKQESAMMMMMMANRQAGIK